MELPTKVTTIAHSLEQEYHSPRHYNKRNPMDELLFILLSLRTAEPIYVEAYKTFKKRYPRWSDVCADSVANIAATLRNCGLADQKAQRLKKALDKITVDFSYPTLKHIKSYNDEQMQLYLMRLPGLGIKAARCIMMYSFDRAVLPVDSHTYRVSQRLGLMNEGLSSASTHRVMDAIIPASLRYVYHVNCVAHGRAVCKAKKPSCTCCVVVDCCDWYKATRIAKLG
jgi:endonuclease III